MVLIIMLYVLMLKKKKAYRGKVPDETMKIAFFIVKLKRDLLKYMEFQEKVWVVTTTTTNRVYSIKKVQNAGEKNGTTGEERARRRRKNSKKFAIDTIKPASTETQKTRGRFCVIQVI